MNFFSKAILLKKWRIYTFFLGIEPKVIYLPLVVKVDMVCYFLFSQKTKVFFIKKHYLITKLQS